METIINLLFYALHWGIETVFLLVALVVMVKIQKFQFTLLGLLGCAALASALDMIPYIGHLLALPVLYISLIKVTREDFTGVVFTAAISYALVFGMNLFLLSSLIDNLRPSPREATETESVPQQVDNEDQAEAAPSQPSSLGRATNSGSQSLPTNPHPTAASVPVAPVAPAAAPAKVVTTTPNLASLFSLKGVTKNANNSMALVSTGAKTYTIGLGESISMETPKGKFNVTLEKVNDNSVVLNVGGGRVTVSR